METKRSVKNLMPLLRREREPASPDQLLRLFRLRPRVGSKKKLRQIDLATLIGVETRTLQLWRAVSVCPVPTTCSADQRPLAEHLLLLGEEEQEARRLWEAVSQVYDERPGTYRLYPYSTSTGFVVCYKMQRKRQQWNRGSGGSRTGTAREREQ